MNPFSSVQTQIYVNKCAKTQSNMLESMYCDIPIYFYMYAYIKTQRYKHMDVCIQICSSIFKQISTHSRNHVVGIHLHRNVNPHTICKRVKNNQSFQVDIRTEFRHVSVHINLELEKSTRQTFKGLLGFSGNIDTL